MSKNLLAGGLASRLFFLRVPALDYASGEKDFDEQRLRDLQGKIKTNLEKGGERCLVEMTPEAQKRFREFDEANYNDAQDSNTLKNLTVRFGALCLKMALSIALFNGEDKVSLKSMESALSVIEYSKATLTDLFGPASVSTPECQVREFIEKSGAATKTEITKRFSHTFERMELDEALSKLLSENAISETKSTGARGRKTTTYAPIVKGNA